LRDAAGVRGDLHGLPSPGLSFVRTQLRRAEVLPAAQSALLRSAAEGAVLRRASLLHL
jgi:hypothetical protein